MMTTVMMVTRLSRCVVTDKERTVLDCIKDMDKISGAEEVISNLESVEKLNALLHGVSEYIIGRMGIPYREKGIYIISIAIDAPQDTISEVSGKIGRLDGVSIKTAYSNVVG